ncbi:MAG: hypothetical protein D6807_05555 [Alphaproteobacteria bacterium]|nr:MAG: hypothetical protein D6807_05555 [Alphaproteobacteria bacterium]
MSPRRDAERRLDAIAGFREEARRLEAMGLLNLGPAEKKAIASYHDEVLRDLEADAGLKGSARPAAPWTMRLAALLGALTLGGIVLALLDRVWGGLASWLQIAVALVAPLVPLLLAEALFRTGRDRFFVLLATWFAVAAFALDLRIVTAILNHPMDFAIVLAVGAFAAALGHRHLDPLLTAAGTFAAGAALAAIVALADGATAAALLHRADPVLLLGIAAWSVGAFAGRWPHVIRFGWRLAGLLLAGPTALLLTVRDASLLIAAAGSAAALESGLLALFAALALFLGLQRGWRESAHGGLVILWLLAIAVAHRWLTGALPAPVEGLLLLLAVAILFGLGRLLNGLLATAGERS